VDHGFFLAGGLVSAAGFVSAGGLLVAFGAEVDGVTALEHRGVGFGAAEVLNLDVFRLQRFLLSLIIYRQVHMPIENATLRRKSERSLPRQALLFQQAHFSERNKTSISMHPES
jgi:hypothetical protein